jgi:hypothetical protein
MITKLIDKNQAIAFPLKTVVFAKGKKAITTNKKMVDCLSNFEMISTGDVKR